MKRKLKLIIMITVAVSLASCEKLVEVNPQNTLPPSQVTNTVSGYNALLSAVYDRLQAYTYWGRDMVLEGDALADNIFTVTSQSGSRYNSQNLFTKSATYNIWTSNYAGINDLNTIIAGIDAVSGGSAAGNQIKAEAYALRGLFYFDLARVYGYEPNSAQAVAFNKSAVLRLTPTLQLPDATTLNRNTIVETYTQIESDFLASIKLFQGLGSVKLAKPYRFSEAAAHGFLAKVYLYWQKYPECVTQCQAATTTTNAILTPVGTYSAAFKKIPNTEAILELNYVQTVEVAGVVGQNDAPYTYTQPTNYGFAGVGLAGVPNTLPTFGGQTVSAELLAAFDAPNDDRKAMFFTSRTSTTTTTYTWCNKYSGNNGPYTDNIEMLRYSDVLLMQAEALAAQGSYTAAQTLVQTLRNARNAAVPAVPGDATIVTFIQNERRRELFFEGQRFFDLKRLGQGITKPALTAVGTIAPTDIRILAPLPTTEVTFNPNLPQNPGY